ncbi:Alpha/Beta hydrolase protein [Podospora australis]|uniref:Alpha/Beta hydrolase protein n=1 Tax=Podospora australis TaxID=1536484 RepID=A0AAN6X438_9PEZI|nr:Alpha/Beta hydrolase protein [Podospora australis]
MPGSPAIVFRRCWTPSRHVHWYRVHPKSSLHMSCRSTLLRSPRFRSAVQHGSPFGLGSPTLMRTRSIHIQTVPLLFTGMLICLWIWKCFTMVIFQNKIIYMPGLPPNARREVIQDWLQHCGGIKWREERTKAEDGTDLALAVTTIPLPTKGRPVAVEAGKPPAAHAYILYFQGNASSIPPRLPDLSWVLRAVSDSKAPILAPMQLTFVCLSYRGYWTSRGRPSERGIRLDAEAGVRWIADQHERTFGVDGNTKPLLLLWGQSIGSGVATNLAATGRIPTTTPIRAMILETPFLSIRSMLETLYPQKWLPYQYLWPFLRNHLDSWQNMALIAQAAKEQGKAPPFVYIIQAERDELVPKEQTEKLYERCLDLGLPVERGIASVAYHQEAIARGQGKKLASQAILALTKRALDDG